ncbi:zonular occludens toxin domain-containing protein [Vibrio sp. 1974]|uniref:zonular occludens toxin domain-containing protein n=1 Tax=Vibrio sp. 1974 TaxID=3074584 RepID=UPI002965FA39|nr:zonular occludens toxin domain-containing protein [Vibrio sp. 1974]MDW3122211.1 zonular occludens toxin domain-containing protein [Vibrio sp. 1974]MDW3122218.1 zonular occludens toxin domain-containing protein [Vibrio sp. 1974]
MIYLRTGLPGASKTLNSLFEICNDHQPDRPKYYNNIKLLMLDYDVATSFSGWYYGWYFPRLKNKQAKKRLIKIMKRVHADDEFLTLEDVPWLAPFFEEHDHFETWLYWVRRCYSPKSRKDFEETLENCIGTSAYNFESVSRFNFHFTKFEDPKTWHQLPKTSIILMDEAQQYFPPRGVNAKNPSVPLHIGKFETHRHDGFDVHIITQDPKLIDVNIRRLVGRHIHFYNPTGGERVTRYENPKAFDPEQWHDKQSAQKSLIKREKAFYGVYWSAEIHTHKFKVPRFVYYFIGLILFLAVMAYMVYAVLFKEPEQPAAPTKPATEQTKPPRTPTANEPETALASHLESMLEGIFIDGVVVQHSDGAQIYHYTFSKSETGEVFYPDNLGLYVEPVNQCTASINIGTVQHFVTCDPFYKRTPEPEQEFDSPYNSELQLASN